MGTPTASLSDISGLWYYKRHRMIWTTLAPHILFYYLCTSVVIWNDLSDEALEKPRRLRQFSLDKHDYGETLCPLLIFTWVYGADDALQENLLPFTLNWKIDFAVWKLLCVPYSSPCHPPLAPNIKTRIRVKMLGVKLQMTFSFSINIHNGIFNKSWVKMYHKTIFHSAWKIYSYSVFVIGLNLVLHPAASWGCLSIIVSSTIPDKWTNNWMPCETF